MVRKSFQTMVLFAIGFIWMFVAGALISWFILCRTDLFTKNDPIIPINKIAREEYDILFVSKDEPHKLLFIDYYKAGKIIYGNAHYYDGSSWKQETVKSETVNVLPINSTNQSAYKINGTVGIDATKIDFSAPEIYTDMTVRARVDFSKFGGATETPSAKITIGENSFDSYSALLVGFNSTEELVDWQSLGVKTDWLMLFDKDWNFYHLDNTVVDIFSPLYESHSFFAKSTNFGNVTYFPNFSLIKSQGKLSIKYGQFNKLDINFTATFDRKDYDGISWGGLATDTNGGVGVYLNINTHQ